MVVISSGTTIFVKWAPWVAILSVAAWGLMRIATDIDGGAALLNYWWAIAVLPLAALFHYLTAWQVVDAVFDCGDYLLVRRGRKSVRVPLLEISRIRLGLYLLGDQRREVVLELKERTELGSKIHFLPIYTQLPAPYARVGIANHLRLRVERAIRDAA